MTSTRQFRNFESKFLNANSSVSTFKVFSWNWLPFASDFMGKFYWKVFVNSNILHDNARFVKLVKRNMQDREMSSQGGNYGNLLSHILCKNFVKVTVLLKKLLNSWFDEFFFSESKSISVFFPQCAQSMWKNKKKFLSPKKYFVNSILWCFFSCFHDIFAKESVRAIFCNFHAQVWE